MSGYTPHPSTVLQSGNVHDIKTALKLMVDQQVHTLDMLRYYSRTSTAPYVFQYKGQIEEQERLVEDQRMVAEKALSLYESIVGPAITDYINALRSLVQEGDDPLLQEIAHCVEIDDYTPLAL